MKHAGKLVDRIPSDLVESQDVGDITVSEILLRVPPKSHGRLTVALKPLSFIIHEGLLTPFKWACEGKIDSCGAARLSWPDDPIRFEASLSEFKNIIPVGARAQIHINS
jgi:hypothetical protein